MVATKFEASSKLSQLPVSSHAKPRPNSSTFNDPSSRYKRFRSEPRPFGRPGGCGRRARGYSQSRRGVGVGPRFGGYGKLDIKIAPAIDPYLKETVTLRLRRESLMLCCASRRRFRDAEAFRKFSPTSMRGRVHRAAWQALRTLSRTRTEPKLIRAQQHATSLDYRPRALLPADPAGGPCACAFGVHTYATRYLGRTRRHC